MNTAVRLVIIVRRFMRFEWVALMLQTTFTASSGFIIIGP